MELKTKANSQGLMMEEECSKLTDLGCDILKEKKNIKTVYMFGLCVCVLACEMVTCLCVHIHV